MASLILSSEARRLQVCSCGRDPAQFFSLSCKITPVRARVLGMNQLLSTLSDRPLQHHSGAVDSRSLSLKRHLAYLRRLVAQGGPLPQDDHALTEWINHLADEVQEGQLTPQELKTLQSSFGAAFSEETMQGFAYLKPHGYAGDYEIIDRIYTHYQSGLAHLRNWDRYWQQHSAAKAVRNRKAYFHQCLREVVTWGRTTRVLNLASGPGRDLKEFFQGFFSEGLHVHCVDQDERAIAHAQQLCEPYLERIRFEQANAVRVRLDQEAYDFIWSAGLFDYLPDRLFVRLLQKLMGALGKSGEIVIGNFSPRNPSRKYMELFEWNLIHRSEAQLRELALLAGCSPESIDVRSEEEGVNLFLHIKH